MANLPKTQMINSVKLFYGNNVTALVNEQKKLKSQGYIFYKGDVLSLNSVLYSNNLFGEHQKIILDSQVVEISDFIKLIQKNNKFSCDVVYFYFENSLKPSLLKLFSSTTKLSLYDEKIIFKIVDSIFLNNLSKALSYVDSFSKDEDKIFLTYMLFSTLKNLMYFYCDKNSYSSLNPYIQTKIKDLSSKISFERLKIILTFMSEVDYKIKLSSDKNSVLFSTIFYLASIK